MANIEDVAQDMYGVAMSELTSGEKLAVEKAYDRQLEREMDGENFNIFDDELSLAAEEPAEAEAPISSTGVNEVEFGRPGVNGVKKSLVNDGTTVSDAFAQTGLEINKDKEGFIVKRSNHYAEGDKLGLTDKVYDGDLIMIVPGVDSSL